MVTGPSGWVQRHRVESIFRGNRPNWMALGTRGWRTAAKRPHTQQTARHPWRMTDGESVTETLGPQAARAPTTGAAEADLQEPNYLAVSLFSSAARPDFLLAALFLWMTCLVAALSKRREATRS